LFRVFSKPEPGESLPSSGRPLATLQGQISGILGVALSAESNLLTRGDTDGTGGFSFE
jgi:hypothetical protein